jgi:hypothetical protein
MYGLRVRVRKPQRDDIGWGAGPHLAPVASDWRERIEQRPSYHAVFFRTSSPATSSAEPASSGNLTTRRDSFSESENLQWSGHP